MVTHQAHAPLLYTNVRKIDHMCMPVECEKAQHTYGKETAGQVVESEQHQPDNREVHES